MSEVFQLLARTLIGESSGPSRAIGDDTDGHIAARITCRDDETFAVIVLRGFAENVRNDPARLRLERIRTCDPHN